MASAQTLFVEQAKLNTEKEVPRIDLEKIDNIPYYIESKQILLIRFDRK